MGALLVSLYAAATAGAATPSVIEGTNVAIPSPAPVSVVTRPNQTGVAFGAQQAMPNVPGPARVAPPANFFPNFNGSGYSVYVCRAAREAGYRSGNLNEAFTFGTDVGDGLPGNGIGANFGRMGGGNSGSRQFYAEDSCNNWNNNQQGQLLIRRLPNQPFFWFDHNQVGNGHYWMNFGFYVAGGLAIQHVAYDVEMTNYKTKGNVGDGDVPVVVQDIAFSVGRDAAPTAFAPATGYQRYDQVYSNIRSCAGFGRWEASIPSLSGSYPGGQGWRDGDYAFPVDIDELGELRHPLGSIYNSAQYRAGGTGQSTPWGPFMAGGGTHARPGGVCNLSGGPSGVYFRGGGRPNQLNLTLACGGPTTNYKGCRGTHGESPEPAGTAPNTWNQHAALRSAKIFVADNSNPSVNLDANPANATNMHANNRVIGSGNGNRTEEVLRFNPSDDSGIRRIEIKLRAGSPTGTLRAWRNWDFTNNCDHRFPAPCPYATGASHPVDPMAKPTSWSLDVDPLIRGTYFVEVRVQDGAGRWGSQTAQFRTDTALREDECTGGATSANDDRRQAEVNRTGVYGQDRVTASTMVCGGRAFNDAVPGAPTETANVRGVPVALPLSGNAVFSYTLAANSHPNAMPLDPGDCQIRDQVISGASSSELSPRELNQIVSITIDLRSFVKQSSGSSGGGGQLGEHVLKSSFDLPTRSTSRYRSALGCPS